MLVYLIPVYSQVFVNEDVSKASKRGKMARKLWWQYPQLSQAQEGFVVVSGLDSVLDSDDAVADINATLRGNLQIALDDITQIRIAIKLRTRFVFKRL